MRKRVSVYLTEQEDRFVTRKAAECQRPVTEMIRRFIDDAMAAEKPQRKGKANG